MMSYGNYYGPNYGGGYYDPYYGYGGGGYYNPYYSYGGGGYYDPYYGYGGGGYYDPYYGYGGGGYYDPYYSYGGGYYNPYYGYGGGYYDPYYGSGGYYPYNMYYQNYYDPYYNYYNSYYPNYSNVIYGPQYVDADLEYLLQCSMYPMIGSGMYGGAPMIGYGTSGMGPMIGSGMYGGTPMIGYGTSGMGMLPQSGVKVSPPVQIGRYSNSNFNSGLLGQGLGNGKLVYISAVPQQSRGMSGLNLNRPAQVGQALIMYPVKSKGVNNVTPFSAQNVNGLSMQQSAQMQPIILNIQPKPRVNYSLGTSSNSYGQMQQQYVRNAPMQIVNTGNPNNRMPSDVVRNRGYFFDSYSSASRGTIPNSLSFYSR